MQTFLSLVVDYVLKKTNNSPQDYTYIFPNQRSKVFFYNELTKKTASPIFAPEAYTISLLFQNISDLQPADTVFLIIELFKIYQQELGQNEGIDDFYFWGETLLNDFNDIDNQLANADAIFKNITELEKIDFAFNDIDPKDKQIIERFWHTTLKANSQQQQLFIKHCEKLPQIYQYFKKHLKSLGFGYEGMINRVAVDKIDEFVAQTKPICFVGLNALTMCEEKLLKKCQENDKALFFWDIDKYYIDDKNQEAGHYLRNNIKHFPFPKDAQELFISDFSNSEIKPEINIISTSGNISQTGALNSIMPATKNKTDNKTNSPNQTCIVLSDESLLLPVLSSLPENVSPINVTMGLPVVSHPLVAFVNLFLNMQSNIVDNKNMLSFTATDVEALLNHQYIKQSYAKEAQSCISDIQKNKYIYIPYTKLHGYNGFFDKLFLPYSSSKSLLSFLLEFIHFAYKNKAEKQDTLLPDSEILYTIYLQLQRIETIIEETDVAINKNTLSLLLKQVFKRTKVPFVGEPLQGVQLLGILETRCIDFENVVILSANEGTMPPGTSEGSFIPYALRKAHHLPTYEARDALYAYYFYRLIQRAKNVTIIYNTDSVNGQSGEMSRFIYQLQYESNLPVVFKTYGNKVNLNFEKNIEIYHNDKIKSVLNDYLNKNRKLSPSALNTFLHCKFKFYLQYVLKVKEPDLQSVAINQSDFGLLFHAAAYKLYEPIVNQKAGVLNKNDYAQLLKTIPEVIDYAFVKNFGKSSSNIQEEGELVLIKEVLKQYLQRLLYIDTQSAPFTIKYIEKQLEEPYYDISFNVDNTHKSIRIDGIIDRVDIKNNCVLIKDYKTGAVDIKVNSLEKLFSRNEPKRNSNAFQILLYTLRYIQFDSTIKVTPQLIGLRNLYINFQPDLIIEKKTILEYPEILTEFEALLKETLTDMFSETTVYQQTTITERCEYCNYKTICNR